MIGKVSGVWKLGASYVPALSKSELSDREVQEEEKDEEEEEKLREKEKKKHDENMKWEKLREEEKEKQSVQRHAPPRVHHTSII